MPRYTDTAVVDGRPLVNARVTMTLVEREQVTPATSDDVGTPGIQRLVWRGRTGSDGTWVADLPVNPKTFDRTYVVTVAVNPGRDLVDEFIGPRSDERIKTDDVIEIAHRLKRPRSQQRILRARRTPDSGAEQPAPPS